jgi:outer membrane receptor protein involved in Fe transport
VDASWGQVRTTNYTASVTSDFIGPIAADNAYVVQNPGLAGAVGNFVDKQWDDQTSSQTDVETTVWRTVIGMDGKFGDTSWTWDGYYEYGHTYRSQVVQDNLHLNESTLALDSVLVNGVPECRSTATGVYPAGYTADPALANGCVPISPFGTAPLTAAQKAYVFGNLVEDLTYTQDVVALNASGNLFDGVGAGPASGAIGAEYRREVGNNVDNPGVSPAVSSDYLIQYGSSFAGKVQVAEAYVEGNMPILKDLPFAHRLDIDAAIRESRYDNNGLSGTDGATAIHNINTWKLSANWEPIEWLRFRGSYSKDARAANFRELYYQQLIGAGGDFGFCGPGGSRTQPCTWNLEGNTNLRPEQSKTTTLGFVLTPKDVLPGFQFAADYFRINITDAIQQANVTAVLQGCEVNAVAADCAQLTQKPGTTGYTDVTGLIATASNGSGYLYKGVDFTSSYHLDLGGTRSVDLRLLSTWMVDQLYQPVPGGPFVNLVGQVGSGNSFLSDFQPTARWVANYTTTYNQGPVSVTGQVRFVSEGIMNYNGVPSQFTAPAGEYSLSTNSVPSYFLFNLNGVYRLPEISGVKMQLFGGINNLLNKVPPFAAGVGAFGATNNFGGTNAVFYDTYGRSFKVGVRATF